MRNDDAGDTSMRGQPQMHGRRFRGRRGSKLECLDPKIDHSETAEERVDELLERLWMFAEDGEPEVAAEDLKEDLYDSEATLARARALELVSGDNSSLKLEPAGEERARQVIRRHRLAEVLLQEILELEEEEIEPGACRFEHILSPKATESICTLLGHPPTCPHGKAIPRGECCDKFSRDLTPLVTPVTELFPGEAARIVFIIPKTHARLDRLGSLGIVPGSTVRLHQKLPTFILQIGETDVAIDPDIAKEIFVRRL